MLTLPLWMTGLAFRLGASAAIVALLVGSCALRDHRIEQRGAAKVVAASKEAGAKANETSRKVRDAARQPGAFERLLKDSCRDC